VPKIKHCGQNRRTDNYWLNSKDPIFKYQILMAATCPKCGGFVLEVIGVKEDLSFGTTKRIAQDKHDEWVLRTDIKTGDIAEGLDSSQWDSQKHGVHWITCSMGVWPYNKIKRRVE
jgi:hypothetical protein